MGLFGSKDSSKDDVKLTRKEMRAFKREPLGPDFGKSRKDWKDSKDAQKKGK